ncbi:MAG: quinone-dependent dihydroorotate dehydrogenase [Elusimicrobia bacterium]|nr:quinone-dependent dihydroorotate dehydrogenase [Elusimicrobiota bacterium]MDE2312961.1 quinone-dependent dihydroorotate dehydrogenase [Elusimicrobiota bacterium]
MLYERVFKPLLFRMDPERAHEAVTTMLKLAQEIPGAPAAFDRCAAKPEPRLSVKAFGLEFPNPIGLAAGFDKNCRMSRVLPALGFGFLELGSVTLRPQKGNARPRVFRLPEEGAVINRLGFPGAGARACAARLARAGRSPVPVGVNLGLNADCPPENAPKEYARTFKILEPYGDYFVVNVSSPNTEGLRELQERRKLEKILEAVRAENKAGKPVLIKVSPDVSDAGLFALVETAKSQAAGIVAGNTTTSRPGVPASAGDVRGGLSGKPLRSLSTGLVRKIFRLSGGRVPIIAAGGVFTGGDALEKIRAGACLVQLYTGLVYRGPGAPRAIARELAELLAQNGFAGVSAAVGTGA